MQNRLCLFLRNSMKSNGKTAICQLSGKTCPLSELTPAGSLHPQVVALLKQKYPNWNPDGYVSTAEANTYRNLYIRQILEDEEGQLSKLDEKVMESIRNADLLSHNLGLENEAQSTLGERIADQVANFGGSWTFIIFFFAFLLGWMGINVFVLTQKPFDPYPFILLNLILSSLAAVQAPIIMMSQNRQEAKDRLRSQYDYQVNLKAELEIRQLHEKIDHLIMHQGQKILELQQIQTEMLEQLMTQKK